MPSKKILKEKSIQKIMFFKLLDKKIYTFYLFFDIIKLYHFRESRYREENIYCY